MAYRQPGSETPANGKGKKLSPKMQAFVEEYLIDLNGAAAVLRAGYKTRNQNRIAAELLRHPLVVEAIEIKQRERSERRELTAEYVLDKLVAIVESVEKDNPNAALRGLELLGKHLGLYRDRQEISGPDGEAIRMEQKVKQDAADFARSISRLVNRGGTGEVVEFPKSGSAS